MGGWRNASDTSRRAPKRHPRALPSSESLRGTLPALPGGGTLLSLHAGSPRDGAGRCCPALHRGPAPGRFERVRVCERRRLSHGPQAAFGVLHSPRRSPTSRAAPTGTRRLPARLGSARLCLARLGSARLRWPRERGATGRPRRRPRVRLAWGRGRQRCAERGGRDGGKERGREKGGRGGGGSAAPPRKPREGPGAAAGAGGLR